MRASRPVVTAVLALTLFSHARARSYPKLWTSD